MLKKLIQKNNTKVTTIKGEDSMQVINTSKIKKYNI